MKQQFFGLISAAVFTLATFSPAASAAEDPVIRGKSSDGSYDYEVYREDSADDITFDCAETAGGAFSCEWNAVQFVSCSKGHHPEPDDQAECQSFGRIDCDYAMEYSADGISKFGVHGWIKNTGSNHQIYPLIEYYIIDGYNEWRPCEDQEPLGQITDNGCTYDIYCVNHIQPAEMHATFLIQYFSIVTEADNPVRNDGTASVSHQIDVKKHFQAWEQAGMNMSGNLYSVEFIVEGWQCSGSATVTKNRISIAADQDSAALYDFNGDGTFAASDLVLMQEWLLGSADLQMTNWEAADFNQNNRIDAADFSRMKQALLIRK